MDVLGDSEQGIFEFKGLHSVSYIEIYGLLQALFLQQDAVRFIADVFNIELTSNEKLKNIRDLRNDAIGHPMNRGKFKSFHFISRISISRHGFTLMSHDGDTGKDEFRKIILNEVLDNQSEGINLQLKEIYDFLIGIENNHRKLYRMEILNDFFPKNIGYLFQAINCAPESNPRVGQAASNISMLKDSVVNFEKALEERDELNDNEYIKENIAKLNFAITKLESLLGRLPASDDVALEYGVYSEYAENRLSDLATVACEIDERYQSEIE
jgi:hypothetical protein